jgi:hypothetical protein
MAAVSELYAPLIARDVEAIPAAVKRFRASASADQLFAAVTRFAVLAYAPSQHAKHALLACVAAYELRDELGDRWDDVLTECAIYAASSRQPWSEPPIGDPPPITDDQPRHLGEMLAAIEAGDRLRGERWLASRLSDINLPRDYFAAALADAADVGHKLIVSAAVWKIAAMFPPPARFATLRVGIWEDVSYRGEPLERQGVALDARTLLERLANTIVAERGAIVAVQALFFFAAARFASSACGDREIDRRVREHLSGCLSDIGARDKTLASPRHIPPHAPPHTPPIYRLARDYGACLATYAVAKWLRRDFHGFDAAPMLAAVIHNLEHGPSFEEFSFA